jgi:hypothetical protein
MRGTHSVRRKTRRLSHPSRSRAQGKRKSRRKSNRTSRRLSRRRRTTRYHRRRGGGTKQKHDSYDMKWLTPDPDGNSNLRLDTPVEMKKSGVEYSQQNHSKELRLKYEDKDILLYTTNHLELIDEKPTTTVLYRSGKICPIRTIEEAPPANEGGEQIYVVWVRHCHSCSNAGGEGIGVITNPMSKFREPLCTALGSRQALDAGYYLSELLSQRIPDPRSRLVEPDRPPAARLFNPNSNKFPQTGGADLVLARDDNCCVRFYSSFLPRTFQTAKLMAASYARLGSSAGLGRCDAFAGHSNVKRLCNVGEETKWYEYENTEPPRATQRGWLPKFPKARLKSHQKEKGSQSVTTQRKSDNHAKYLNDKLKVGFSIEDGHINGCGNGIDGPIAGSRIKNLACDYANFLKDVLPELGKDSECDKGRTISVIVSHGGYIRHCVLQSTKKHPANTQMYLVRYTCPTSGEFPIHAEILSSEESRFDPNTSNNIPTELYEAASKANIDCSYTYHGDMLPPPPEAFVV